MIAGLLLLIVFAISWGGTYVLRRYALSKSLMDVPNERSSHTVPTPRGWCSHSHCVSPFPAGFEWLGSDCQ